MENNKERMIELVSRAKQQDSHAFAELYEMVYQDLYRMALYTLGNPQDAENVVSDTVLDAYCSIGKLREATAFKGWIFKILSNKCNRLLREYVQRRDHEQSLDDMEAGLPTMGNVMKGVEDKTLISQAFRVLSEEEKMIVTMTVYGDMDSGEIAENLKLNRNTVRSKYSRALAKMRSCLGAGGDEIGK